MLTELGEQFLFLKLSCRVKLSIVDKLSSVVVTLRYL